MFPDREYELLSDYSLTLNPNKQTSRQALEYADVNNLGDLTDKLIIRLKESGNSTSKEWASVYELHRKMTTGEVNVIEARDMMCEFTIKTTEMKVFSKVMFLYQYLGKRDFNSLNETIKYIDTSKINNIKSSFLKNSFKCRILMLQANAGLVENDLQTVRKCVNECLEMTNTVRFLAFGHLNIGNSYIFENYDKAKNYFLKGLEACENNPIYKTQLICSLSFLENYWSKDNKYMDESDLHSVAFAKIRKGENKEALEILDSMDQSELNQYQLAYDNFYRGLITNEKSYYYESIKYFKLTGDKFIRKMVLIELQKLGESDQQLELYSM
ncbi:hypothetical protein D3C84_517850 [compost metagenome]